MQYYSQFSQDKFLHENIFKDYPNGYFVDIGAYDGITQGSNSLFFEQQLGWKGVCIEPNPNLYDSLIKNRICECYNYAISDSVGEAKFLYIKEGPGRPDTLGGLTENFKQSDIDSLISDYGLNTEDGYEYLIVKTELFENLVKEKTIQYLSIDVEGNELRILNTIDFDKYDIWTMTIENNSFGDQISNFFKDKPYTLLCKLGCDEVYVKNTLIV